MRRLLDPNQPGLLLEDFAQRIEVGNIEDDLLSITAVHPLREEAVSELLVRAGAGWPVVHRLIAHGQLVETEHEGYTFYMRKLDGRRG